MGEQSEVVIQQDDGLLGADFDRQLEPIASAFAVVLVVFMLLRNTNRGAQRLDQFFRSFRS